MFPGRFPGGDSRFCHQLWKAAPHSEDRPANSWLVIANRSYNLEFNTTNRICQAFFAEQEHFLKPAHLSFGRRGKKRAKDLVNSEGKIQNFSILFQKWE